MDTQKLSPAPAENEPTPSPTPVPAGVFALLDYPPLVLEYDPSLWKDESQYTNPDKRVNYLQAKELGTCTLAEGGGSGFFPTPDQIVDLGGVRYQVTMLQDTPPDRTVGHYIEDQTLTGYRYQLGLPVLEISARPSEWDQCKLLAEKVLATLKAASN